MSLIRDIRLFESNIPNVNGNPIPSYIGKLYSYDDMDALDVIQRLLFLLRSRGFEFPEFHHLYVNFTSCLPHGELQTVNRYEIREFAWYQWVDVGCNAELFNTWTPEEKTGFVLESMRKAALLKAPEDRRQLFSDTFEEVLAKGEALVIPYREKQNETYRVEIMLRITDELDFIPMIRISDKNGIVTELELRTYGRDEFISQISTIYIGKRFVRISPRKNWYADYYGLEPIKIEW